MTDNKTPADETGNNIADFPDEMERLKRLEQKKLAEMKARGIKSTLSFKPSRSPSEPVLNLPPYTKMVCAVLLAVQVIVYFLPVETANATFRYLSFIPALYLDPAQSPLQLVYGPFSHMLLHGGWFHIAVNIGMLLAFGSAVEKFIGGRRMLALFLIAGALGAFSHMALFWASPAPLVGASGGISGLFGALLRSLQDQGQMKPGWRGLMPITLLWVGVSVLFALFASVPGGGAIAWGAHVGGFLGGMLFYGPVMRRIR